MRSVSDDMRFLRQTGGGIVMAVRVHKLLCPWGRRANRIKDELPHPRIDASIRLG